MRKRPIVPAPNDPRQPQGQVLSARSESLKVSSGPIPNPETLAQYEKVYPGLAKTIGAAFEAKYQKRHRLETRTLEADIEAMQLDHPDIKRGQWLGFIICIVGLVSGAILVYLGHDTAGAAIGGGSLASLVAAYFRNSPGQQEKTTEAKTGQLVKA